MTPVRVRTYDGDLAVDRLRVVGFRGVSTAGWKGPVRVVRQDAARDVYEYRATLPHAAPRGEDVSPTGAAEASAGG